MKFPAWQNDQNLVRGAMRQNAKCPLQRHRGFCDFSVGLVLVVSFVSLGCNDENPQPGLAFFYTNKKLGCIDTILDCHDLHDFEIPLEMDGDA